MKAWKDSEAPRKMPHVFSGLLYAFLIMGGAAFLLALLLLLGGQKEESLPASRYVIHAMSLLAGGFMAGRRSGSRGWYAGGMTGLAYSAIISLTGYLGFDKGVDWTSVWFTVGAFLAGALGGMTGVQTKK